MREGEQGIFSKILKKGVPIAAALTLAAGGEGCATVRSSESSHRIENQNFNRVKAEALMQLELGRSNFVKKYGEENFTEVKAGLELFDAGAVANAAEAEWGIPADKFLHRDIQGLSFIDDDGIEKLKDVFPDSKTVNKRAVALCLNDIIYVNLTSQLGHGYRVTRYEMLRTLIHEFLHVLHSRTEENNRTVSQWQLGKNPLPRGFEEGVVEVMTMRLMQRLNFVSRDQGYPGGNFILAYLVEQLSGGKNLAWDYIEGVKTRFLKALDDRLGEEVSEAFFAGQDREDLFGKLTVEEGEETARDQVRLFNFLRLLDNHGQRPEDLLARSADDQIPEKTRVIRGADKSLQGVFFMFEDRFGRPSEYSGVLEQKDWIDLPDIPPLKVVVRSGKGTGKEGDVEAAAQKTIKGLANIQIVVAEIVGDARQAGIGKDEIQFSIADAVRDFSFQFESELRPREVVENEFYQAYAQAGDAKQKAKIFDQISARVESLAREQIAKIIARVKSVTGYK